jgi:hypothetical protein
MFAVDIEDVLARLQPHGAELVGEVAQYEDKYRDYYVRGREGSSSRWPRSSAEAFDLLLFSILDGTSCTGPRLRGRRAAKLVVDVEAGLADIQRGRIVSDEDLKRYFEPKFGRIESSQFESSRLAVANRRESTRLSAGGPTCRGPAPLAAGAGARSCGILLLGWSRCVSRTRSRVMFNVLWNPPRAIPVRRPPCSCPKRP